MGLQVVARAGTATQDAQNRQAGAKAARHLQCLGPVMGRNDPKRPGGNLPWNKRLYFAKSLCRVHRTEAMSCDSPSTEGFSLFLPQPLAV